MMTNFHYSDLITRLSKLDAPDREVDAEIAVLFSGDPDAYVVRPNEGAMFTHVPGWFATGDNKSHKSQAYTSSVDAAIALAERVLPGHGWFVRNETDASHAGIFIPMTVNVIQGRAANPATALLITILRAKEATNGIR
ncbi:hypothetical protein [Brucella anthropi]|uniref:hypothetical protein n=1 Tax=Brucella anthropi TaxID=529 RepID=UPI003D97A364